MMNQLCWGDGPSSKTARIPIRSREHAARLASGNGRQPMFRDFSIALSAGSHRTRNPETPWQHRAYPTSRIIAQRGVEGQTAVGRRLFSSPGKVCVGRLFAPTHTFPARLCIGANSRPMHSRARRTELIRREPGARGQGSGARHIFFRRFGTGGVIEASPVSPT